MATLELGAFMKKKRSLGMSEKTAFIKSHHRSMHRIKGVCIYVNNYNGDGGYEYNHKCAIAIAFENSLKFESALKERKAYEKYIS